MQSSVIPENQNCTKQMFIICNICSLDYSDHRVLLDGVHLQSIKSDNYLEVLFKVDIVPPRSPSQG